MSFLISHKINYDPTVMVFSPLFKRGKLSAKVFRSFFLGGAPFPQTQEGGGRSGVKIK